MLLGFEMSQNSNVTPEHPLFECSLDLNLQKMIHCVSLQRQQKVKVENYLFLANVRLSMGRTFAWGNSPGPHFPVLCVCVVVDVFAAYKMKVSSWNECLFSLC